MNKKIECRAKALGDEKNPNWIYGSLVESWNGNYIYCDVWEDGIPTLVSVKIDIDTLGIKVGTLPFYTGDIIEFEYKTYKGREIETVKTKGEIYFDDEISSFLIKDCNDIDKTFDLLNYKDHCEIIGNKIDGTEE